MTMYITFGQEHRHEINGVVYDKDCVAKIECKDLADGREIAFENFGPKFCFSYDDIKKINLDYYPRGIVGLQATYDWMEEARAYASELNLDAETEEAAAKIIAYWIGCTAQSHRNTDYYRGLVQQCGELLGDEAKTDDTGGIHEEIFCAKVPELLRTRITEGSL